MKLRNPESLFVTGATGTIGSALVAQTGSSAERLDVTSDHGWSGALKNKEAVVHCAALASSRGVDSQKLDEVNCLGTARVARIARDSGVTRFLFLSSVKVFGDATMPGECFSDESPLNPTSAYGESKAKAEQLLLDMHVPGSFEVIIIRPTVVVSAESKGAVGAMWNAARKGYPFPVFASGNRRDFINLDNLVSAIVCCVEHPLAGGRAFSVSDGEAISTGQLFLAMAHALGRQGRLLSIPEKPARMIAKALHCNGPLNRILGNLEVDDSLVRTYLGWSPLSSTLGYLKSVHL